MPYWDCKRSVLSGQMSNYFLAWCRVRLIPLTVAIPSDEVNPDLPVKLQAEWPGILAWAVLGCLKWQPASANVSCCASFLDAGNNETVRQKAPRREVAGSWALAGSECCVMLVPISMMGGTPARPHLDVCTHARSGAFSKHFGVGSERINGRSADWWM
jgi:hypothetical protein